jgi:hypothetical protein
MITGDSLIRGKAMTKKRFVRGLIVFMTLLALGLIALWYNIQPRPNANALAIGTKAATQNVVSIDLSEPVSLNFLSKAQVLDLRRKAVLRYPQLVSGAYTPADSVFGEIQDGKPWWGAVSLWYLFASNARGERSILGPADQSRYLANPYLLVAADVYPVPANNKEWQWDRSKTTEAGALNGSFPLLLTDPSDLRWMPAQRRAEVTYHVTDHIATINPYMVNQLRADRVWVDLTAYNARDFNLNYIYVSYKDSKNAAKSDAPTEAYENPQYLHTGPSCGYPGGCNNRSPSTPPLDNLLLSPLPADVTIYLWKNKPTSVSEAPDFTFVMHFD